MWKFVTKVTTGTLQIFSAFFAMRFPRQESRKLCPKERKGGREEVFLSKWSPGNYFDFM